MSRSDITRRSGSGGQRVGRFGERLGGGQRTGRFGDRLGGNRNKKPPPPKTDAAPEPEPEPEPEGDPLAGLADLLAGLKPPAPPPLPGPPPALSAGPATPSIGDPDVEKRRRMLLKLAGRSHLTTGLVGRGRMGTQS